MILLLAVAAMVGGAIAALAGFGIGSVLTPTLAIIIPTKIAVAAVSIPHALATGYRLWRVRRHVDFAILKSFGAMSALGGLAGALANWWLASRALSVVLGVLLILVGLGGLSGRLKELRFVGPWAWIAGGVSGFLGGLVGNQGGLRAGAMMGLGVSRDAFVATTTATALIVDAARMPVYLVGQWSDLRHLWPFIGVMCFGVIVGTVAGVELLRRIREDHFLQVVSVLLVLLGAWLATKP